MPNREILALRWITQLGAQNRYIIFFVVQLEVRISNTRNATQGLALLLQPNGWMDNWVDFFAVRRLGHMLRLLGDSELNELGRKLLPKLGKFFEGIEASHIPCCSQNAENGRSEQDGAGETQFAAR